jgi:hypothetical protein
VKDDHLRDGEATQHVDDRQARRGFGHGVIGPMLARRPARSRRERRPKPGARGRQAPSDLACRVLCIRPESGACRRGKNRNRSRSTVSSTTALSVNEGLFESLAIR